MNFSRNRPFYTNILFVVKQYNSSTKTHWQITAVYWLLTPPLESAFKALLNVVCMGYIGLSVCICCVYFRQKLNSQLFWYHASAFECILNIVNPRYQTAVNSVTMNPAHGYMTPTAEQSFGRSIHVRIYCQFTGFQTAVWRAHWRIIWECAEIVLTCYRHLRSTKDSVLDREDCKLQYDV
jgi:hypothetical protein